MKKMQYIPVLLVLFGLISCADSEEQGFTSPKGYNLNQPQVFKMPPELKEISGNAFYDRSGDSLYAIQDEDGYIYCFKPGGGAVLATKFGKKGDYEDISIWQNTAYVLRSDGVLYGIPMNELGKPKADNVKEWEGLLPEGEYESMFADKKTNALYIMCKTCKADHHTSTATVYVFDLSGDTIALKNEFGFETKTFSNFLNAEPAKHFKPGAIARNPITNEWYILSSVNKLLVVADAQWRPKQAYRLNRKIFEQPEGISFDKAGNLYISSEAGTTPAGVVLKFAYHPK